MKILLATVFLLIAAFSAAAQTALTNDDVIEMVQAELGDEIVLAKIHTSAARFDTSVSALVKLREAKVSDAVLIAMLDKMRPAEVVPEKSAPTTGVNPNKSPEYGSIFDLDGVKKVYLDTGTDLDVRERIIEQFRKEQFTEVEIVNSVDEADCLMVYSFTRESRIVGATTSDVYGTNSTSTTIDRRTSVKGKGVVLVQGKYDKSTPRIAMVFDGAGNYAWSKAVSKQFASAFIKAYREANNGNTKKK